jgi:hypothetical protein
MSTENLITKEFCDSQSQMFLHELRETKEMIKDIHTIIYKNGLASKIDKLHTNQKWHWRAIAGLTSIIGVIFCLLGFIVERIFFS